MILSQSCQQALHADCVVSVIHDDTAFLRSIYNLHTAIDFQVLQGMLQLFSRNAHPQSNGRCRQRIVYIKFTRMLTRTGI